MQGLSQGARPGAQSGTGPPEGSGQRQVKMWAALSCRREGGRGRAAPPREGVVGPPARARWVPCPLRPSRHPQAGSRAWSATLSSGGSGRGRRHPVAARPSGRWMPDSPRPLGGGGEAGPKRASLCPAGPSLQHPQPRLRPRGSSPHWDTFFWADTRAEKLALSVSCSWGGDCK